MDLERRRLRPPVRPEWRIAGGSAMMESGSWLRRPAAVRSRSSICWRLRFLSVERRWDPASSS